MKRAQDATTISQRVEQLAQLRATLGADLPAPQAQYIDEVVARARERLALDPEVSVVALVGATGSGKSSLVNALVGADVARVGVRRPTTTAALAVCPAGRASSELFDWLGIEQRVVVPEGGGLPANVAVIDLPDIDSIDRRNREIVDRLAQRVDILIWVADPQKYADQVLHHDFIRPLAHHSQVTLVTLTQVDRLTPADAERIRTDLERLVEADGIRRPQVFATSALTGQGMTQLRDAIARLAQAQRQRAARLHADVDAALTQIRDSIGEFDANQLRAHLNRNYLPTLEQAALKAAGAEAIAEAVRRAYIHRGMRRCGWLPVRGLRSLRADPLKRLHLQGDGSDQVHSLPAPRASAELLHVQGRDISQQLAPGRPAVWQRRLQQDLTDRFVGLEPELNHAIARTDLRMPTNVAFSWRAFNALQWLMWAIAAAGALWLGAIVVARNFLLIQLEPPYWHGIAVPTLILVAGLLATVVVSLVAAALIRLTARRRRRQAYKALAKSVSEVVEQRVWVPVAAELRRQSELAQALKP